MGATGLAANNNNSSFDINPAVLTNYFSKNISLAANFNYYNYNLLRISEQVGGTTWDWGSSKLTLEQASVVYPLNKIFSIGVGIFQKLDPQLVNKKRAITFSDLFSQETKGGVYSAAFSAGIKIIKEISLGISVYNYFGNIESRVTGDNHGYDIDKWAFLESKLSGINFRGGMLIIKDNWSAGLVFETPFKMNVNSNSDISSDAYFKSLLPEYDQTELNMPWILGVGFSFNGYENWLFEIDVETRQYNKSKVKFNLYEFGGIPVWETTNIFRAGVQYYDKEELNIPVRVGYAYIPQLYYSNNSVGVSNNIISYNNTSRNIKNVFTMGTAVKFSFVKVNLNLEYSIVKWDRTLVVPFTITDEYSEKDFIFSTQVIFKL
jgi:hypothetical protein